MNKNKIVIAVIVISVIAITGFFYFKKLSSQLSGIANPKKENLNIANKNETNSQQKSCESGWNYYRHDVLGIEFCYQSSWGEPKTDPIENLTRISQMENDFKQLNIYYNNSISIVFDNNISEIGSDFKLIELFMFNDKYKIESEQPHDYYDAGITKGAINLAKNSNICSYQIGYDYKYNDEMSPNTLSTVASECTNEVKLLLTEDREYFNFGGYGTLYTYDLRMLAFKKLKNEHFNNVLINYPFDSAHQIKEKVSGLDEFFKGSKTTQVQDGLPKKTRQQLDEERKAFEKFVASISTFKPIEKSETKFETIDGENPDMTLIRKYYWLLENGKLNDAYSISTGGAKDFAEYQIWYGNIYAAKPQQINKTGEHRYEFYVDYQDHNNPKTRYHVIMDVSGEKINTQLAEEITSEEIKSGSSIAFTKMKSGKNYVILNKNGKEIIVDEGVSDYNAEYSNIADVKFYGDLRFSPTGRYLMYRMFGWEWSVGYVYDIINEKSVYTGYGIDKFEFTPDEKYFFDCSSSGLSSGRGGDIYDTTKFNKPLYKIPEDAFTSETGYDYLNVDCSYDSTGNSVDFRLNNDDSSEPQTNKNINYNLNTGTITFK